MKKRQNCDEKYEYTKPKTLKRKGDVIPNVGMFVLSVFLDPKKRKNFYSLSLTGMISINKQSDEDLRASKYSNTTRSFFIPYGTCSVNSVTIAAPNTEGMSTKDLSIVQLSCLVDESHYLKFKETPIQLYSFVKLLEVQCKNINSFDRVNFQELMNLDNPENYFTFYDIPSRATGNSILSRYILHENDLEGLVDSTDRKDLIVGRHALVYNLLNWHIKQSGGNDKVCYELIDVFTLFKDNQITFKAPLEDKEAVKKELELLKKEYSSKGIDVYPSVFRNSYITNISFNGNGLDKSVELHHESNERPALRFVSQKHFGTSIDPSMDVKDTKLHLVSKFKIELSRGGCVFLDVNFFKESFSTFKNRDLRRVFTMIDAIVYLQ